MALPVLWRQVEPVMSRRLGGLGLAGLASLALYILFAVRYPLWPSLAEPRASWSTLVAPSWANTLLHLGIYLSLTLLYAGSLRLLVSTSTGGKIPENPFPSSRRSFYILIVVVWLACSIALLAAAPAGESHDIFDYLFRGRMMAEYRGNPLVDPPKMFSAAPYYRYIAWYGYVDTYGPLWELTSAGVAVSARFTAEIIGWWGKEFPFCPGSSESCRMLVVYLTGYRSLAVLLTGLSGWLVASLVRRNRPALAPAALAAWLWCPMTLIAGAVGGHNDMPMIVFVLLGLWLLQRQRPLLALIAVLLAAHVKLTALIWLPAVALWILLHYGWRHALKVGFVSLVVGLGLSWLMYAPFGGWSSLPRMLDERSQFLANSIWSLLYKLFYGQMKWNKELVRRFTVDLPTWLLGAVALLVPLWAFNLRPKRWRKPNFTQPPGERTLWAALVAISLLVLLLGTYWFQHWYVLWVLTPAVLLPDSRFTRGVLPWLVFGALSANWMISFVVGSAQSPPAPIWLNLLVIGMIWGPALLAGWNAFRNWRLAPSLS